jgi:hypothetical protein
VHELDTDAGTWSAIWDRVAEESLLYIRRPTRAAETAVSGIVLAQGTSLPSAPEPGETPPGPADSGGLIEDEEQVFLKRINVAWLGTLRPPVDAPAHEAWEQLDREFGDDAAAVQFAVGLLLRVGRAYDPPIWRTLLQLLQHREDLLGFDQRLNAALASGTATGAAVVEAAGTLLTPALRERWLKLDQASEPQ